MCFLSVVPEFLWIFSLCSLNVYDATLSFFLLRLAIATCKDTIVAFWKFLIFHWLSYSIVSLRIVLKRDCLFIDLLFAHLLILCWLSCALLNVNEGECCNFQNVSLNCFTDCYIWRCLKQCLNMLLTLSFRAKLYNKQRHAEKIQMKKT